MAGNSEAFERHLSALEKQAKLGTLAFRAITSSAIIQGIITVLFGLSLIWSYTQDNLLTSPSYEYLEDTAGWPWLVGVIYASLGIIQIYSRFSRDNWTLSASAFAVQTVTTSLFAAAHFIGTFSNGDQNILFGPQWLYPGWAALTAVHTYFAFQASRVGD